MAGAVPRRVDAAQAQSAAGELVAVVDELGVKVRRAVEDGGVVRQHVPADRLGHALGDIPAAAALPVDRVDDGVVRLVHQHPRAHLLQEPGVAGVVGVHVCQEDVHPLGLDAQLPQGAEKGVPALGPVEARVDQQMPAAVLCADQIAVEPFERVPGQGDVDAEHTAEGIVDHGRITDRAGRRGSSS